MKRLLAVFSGAVLAWVVLAQNVRAATSQGDFFAPPARGFVSEQPARDWQQGLLTGNGTTGAIVLGNPYDETLYLSHASLYLPLPVNPGYISLAPHLAEIQRLCLEGNYAGAANLLNAARKETSYDDKRDPFIGACVLHVKQPVGKPERYQRAVDTMTAETSVSVADETGSFQRRAFVSRPDGVLVMRLAGSGKQTADFSFAGLPVAGDKLKAFVAENIRSTQEGVRDGLLYFRTLFAHGNPYNPNAGFEVVGKVIARGGTRTETEAGIHVAGADEILVLIEIRPLLVSEHVESNLDAVRQKFDALPADYERLLASQAKAQGGLMGRVSLSLEAPTADRAKSNEQLIKDSQSSLAAPLGKIERAFDAGRYNIICSTGFYPPNLQGIWSGTWSAPWSGSFTTDGNLPVAVAFLLMGNTPELMQAYFRYYDERWAGFRENARVFYGTRGFHVPAQLTLSPRETDFSVRYPLCYWHAAAPWALEYYFDYYRYTGDRKFLEERAYPLMKEACAFYEDFLTVKGPDGKVAFVPDYSPENTPGGEKKVPTTINATMDIAAARQLLTNTTAAAKLLNRDADLQTKWMDLLARLPKYEVGKDGSFREWLWSDEPDNHQHRHASQLYPLYDERPAEIVQDAKLVKAVEHTIGERLAFREKAGDMAFGVVQIGLAAVHIGNAELAQQTINILGQGYWSTGMGSFHNRGSLFNVDISGGFPYLCASALVYSEPGRIQFFPARPPQWPRGSLRGVRLRGGIVVRELKWDGEKAEATLVSDTDQTVQIELPQGQVKPCALRAGEAVRLDL